MKNRITVSIVCLLLTIALKAQIYKTVTIVAGSLKSSLTATELSNVTNLTIYGTIDARDFKTMRDDLKRLTVVDLTGCDSIVQYIGSAGTGGAKVITYPAHEVPLNAFDDCLYLKIIELPLITTSIGKKAFYSCGALISCHLPESIKHISNSAFSACTSMTTINFPTSITEIGDSAFFFCLFLPSASIPSVTKMGKAVFYQCVRLTSVELPLQLDTLQTSTFEKCIRMPSLLLPTNLKCIEKDAFKQNSALTSLTIPSGVVSIKDSVFLLCKSLKSLRVLNPIPVDLSGSKNVFFNGTPQISDINKDSCTLIVPVGSLTDYKTAPQWRDFTHIIEETPTIINIASELITTISTQDNTLIISGLFGNEQISVFDLSGIQLTSFVANNETALSNLPTKGIFIVLVDSKSYKIVNQ